jgi:hypothetical protein
MAGWRNAVLVILSLLLAMSAAAQEAPPTPKAAVAPPPPDPWFVGGAIGFAFGDDVNYAEFSPILGFRVSQKFQLGASLTFRYRKDKRYEPDLSTTDAGGSLFGRYFVLDPIFLQVEVERLNWEFVDILDDEFVVVDSVYTGYYAGLGYYLPMGSNGAMYMSFMWDFSYDSNEPSPNPHPWLIRIGYGVTF